MCVRAGMHINACAGANQEEKVEESILSTMEIPGIKTQVIRLGGKYLYTLSH